MTEFVERTFHFISTRTTTKWVLWHHEPCQWIAHTLFGERPSDDDRQAVEDEVRAHFHYARAERLGVLGTNLNFRIARKDAMVFKLRFCGAEIGMQNDWL